MEGYYHHYKMVHVENSDKVIDGLQLIFVELPKFTLPSLSENYFLLSFCSVILSFAKNL